MTLTEFLLARIAEDETNIDGDWADGYGLHILSSAMHDRMVREVEAKRRIITVATGWPAGSEVRMPMRAVLEKLAAVYADHPDYDEAWRP